MGPNSFSGGHAMREHLWGPSGGHAMREHYSAES